MEKKIQYNIVAPTMANLTKVKDAKLWVFQILLMTARLPKIATSLIVTIKVILLFSGTFFNELNFAVSLWFRRLYRCIRLDKEIDPGNISINKLLQKSLCIFIDQPTLFIEESSSVA